MKKTVPYLLLVPDYPCRIIFNRAHNRNYPKSRGDSGFWLRGTDVILL